MTGLIALLMTAAATLGGYLFSRAFVRRRLRFVGAVHGVAAPALVGLAAALVATPIVWILPLVGTGTAALFGFGVGAGVAVGAREIRRRLPAR